MEILQEIAAFIPHWSAFIVGSIVRFIVFLRDAAITGYMDGRNANNRQNKQTKTE